MLKQMHGNRREGEIAKAVTASNEAKLAAKNAQQEATWSKDESKKFYLKNVEIKD